MIKTQRNGNNSNHHHSTMNHLEVNAPKQRMDSDPNLHYNDDVDFIERVDSDPHLEYAAQKLSARSSLSIKARLSGKHSNSLNLMKRLSNRHFNSTKAFHVRDASDSMDNNVPPPPPP